MLGKGYPFRKDSDRDLLYLPLILKGCLLPSTFSRLAEDPRNWVSQRSLTLQASVQYLHVRAIKQTSIPISLRVQIESPHPRPVLVEACSNSSLLTMRLESVIFSLATLTFSLPGATALPRLGGVNLAVSEALPTSLR